MTKTSLVKGTAVLAAAGLFVKFLGAFFRIPLANMIGAAGGRTMQGSRAGVSSFADADVYGRNNRIWDRVPLCRGDRRAVSCTGCVSFDASYGTGTVSGPAGRFLSWVFPGNEQYDPYSCFSNHGADLSCGSRTDNGYVPEG